VFERFTERARQVVVLAQHEARALKHNVIGTEHILLGLLREEEGLAARVLGSLGVTIEAVRTQVVEIHGEPDEVADSQIPFTPRAKKVLELAPLEARALGHNYLGTEHILLGLIRAVEGAGLKVLVNLGLDAETIRTEVISVLSRKRLRSPSAPVADTASMTVGELLDSLSAQQNAVAELDKLLDEALRALAVGELIEAVSLAKEARIEKLDFEGAAMLRDIERRLVTASKSTQPATRVDERARSTESD
jgi:ATP-dependent Clp protease ATP-binding subunit ClpC